MSLIDVAQLKVKIWQLILLAVVVLAVIVVANFVITSYMNSACAFNLDASQGNEKELKQLVGESLGKLSETQNQLSIETQKREAVEKILLQGGTNAEKLQAYETAKLGIIVDGGNSSTDALCSRAAKFGITCLTK